MPPGVAPDFYAELIAELRGRGKYVALDTSGPALTAALNAEVLPQLVKPNQHELSAALGRELQTQAEILAAARELLERGAELVAVSQGEDGALFVSRTQTVQALPPRSGRLHRGRRGRDGGGPGVRASGRPEAHGRRPPRHQLQRGQHHPAGRPSAPRDGLEGYAAQVTVTPL